MHDLEPAAPNKSSGVFCHQPVNLLGTDESEDRRCVRLKCGPGALRETIKRASMRTVKGLDKHDKNREGGGKKKKGKKKTSTRSQDYFSQILTS